jgi:hypothetical protein
MTRLLQSVLFVSNLSRNIAFVGIIAGYAGVLYAEILRQIARTPLDSMLLLVSAQVELVSSTKLIMASD